MMSNFEPLLVVSCSEAHEATLNVFYIRYQEMIYLHRIEHALKF